MSVLEPLDWSTVRRHYDDRVRVSESLRKLFQENDLIKFADLALGISDPICNYSASEHGLGPRILGLNQSPQKQLLRLAESFAKLTNARRVPELISVANMKYMKISVGSEISCMVNPAVCWVANTRTIWTHLVIKHADNVAKADEELQLYRDSDISSEMYYPIWSEIHALLDVSLTRIAEEANELAVDNGIESGEITYLWADAIANGLYDYYHR